MQESCKRAKPEMLFLVGVSESRHAVLEIMNGWTKQIYSSPAEDFGKN